MEGGISHVCRKIYERVFVKIKKIKLGVKGVEQVLDVSEKRRALKRERGAKNNQMLSFDDIKDFRKAITPKRVELLHITKKMQPKSMQELARILERDIKSVATDIHLLGHLGLIEMKRKTEGRKEIIPVVDYIMINLEIVI